MEERVNMIGGDISIVSEPGRGTTVSVRGRANPVPESLTASCPTASISKKKAKLLDSFRRADRPHVIGAARTTFCVRPPMLVLSDRLQKHDYSPIYLQRASVVRRRCSLAV